jgi:hypothetical protein
MNKETIEKALRMRKEILRLKKEMHLVEYFKEPIEEQGSRTKIIYSKKTLSLPV